MLDKKFLKRLQADYQKRQQTRHELINTSNTLLREAKRAIFSLHRGDMKEAKETLATMKKSIKQLQKGPLTKQPELRKQGAYLAAIEEYVEADLFYKALNGEKISEITGIDIMVDQYIGGLSDMTGELTRQAVLKATDKDYAQVDTYFDVVTDVVGELMKFDLVSQNRKKFDDAKRNLKRIEGIRYDISMRN